jgi:hypothetical protein
MTKNIVLFLSALVLSFGLLSSPILAEDEYHSLNVRSELKGFSETNWSDDLSNNVILFTGNDKLQGRFTLTNFGNRNETQIKVTVTTPDTITLDGIDQSFTIPEVAIGGSYSKLFTINIKDKSQIKAAVTANTVVFTAKAESGTANKDQSTFYTANGTKTATTSATPTLPDTGSNTLVIGTVLALALGLAAFKLRSYARGY